MNDLNIIGALPSGKRSETDFYPTPPEVTEALLDFLNLPKSAFIWEPACGDGAMQYVMEDRGYAVWGTDIKTGEDFLTHPFYGDFDWIITNPPFSKADAFIERCLQSEKPFALLLKSQFWHAAKRRKMFRENGQTYVCPLTWRPDFTGKGSSMMDVVWNVWTYPRLRTGTATYYPLKKPEAKK